MLYFVQVTCQSDLFSLGITIFFCATGRFPFCKANDDTTTIQYRVANDRTPAENLVLYERSVDPAWQDGLSTIVARALEKSTEHRYATADSMLADLNITRRSTLLLIQLNLHHIYVFVPPECPRLHFKKLAFLCIVLVEM